MTAHRVFSRAGSLMEAEVGDEIVALDVNQGLCFGFNEPASTIWRILEIPRTEVEIVRMLQDEYDAEEEQISTDLQLLLQELTKAGLVIAR